MTEVCLHAEEMMSYDLLKEDICSAFENFEGSAKIMKLKAM